MSLKIKNVKYLKSTLIGFIILGFDLYYWVLIEETDSLILFGMIILGLGLIFSPDSIINNLINLINKVLGNKLGGDSNRPDLPKDEEI